MYPVVPVAMKYCADECLPLSVSLSNGMTEVVSTLILAIVTNVMTVIVKETDYKQRYTAFVWIGMAALSFALAFSLENKAPE